MATEQSTGRPAPAAPADGREDRTARGPRADCTVDRSGDLAVRVVLPGAAAGARLLLRRRGDEQEVRVPLEPAAPGDGDALRAVLPAAVRLAEGRWDAYALPAPGAGRLRLAPGLNDLRALVDQERDPGVSPVAVRIPYATKHANLSVRAWLRPAHAEVEELLVTGAGTAVQARLLGARLSDDAVVEARCRQDPRQVRQAPARRAGAGEEDRFTFTVPHRELTAARSGTHDTWDLWLLPAPGAGAVRVGRLLDDVPDRKKIFTYPADSLDTPRGRVRVQPYYTADNDLSVTVSDLPAP
ncbi:hypothetical protein [Streptomyces sp. HB2AG]|uniref:hypothetical protein n=1 Tax=Streptomyces sp. HB2AG TaxID=2983400 RepID=UPI0022AAC04B|nr:hypothetical protein [Streptomyces sp. HB2AG]MCZ2527453.1 hypothetical protein [Streptomyces sp. HB2AG]